MNEVGLDNLRTVAEAIAILDDVGVVSPKEQVALTDADGRVLADAVLADREYPPFDKALMDGYAVRAADSSAGTLRHVGEIAAGGTSKAELKAGECVAIMTGAPLPAGADAVVPIEQTSISGDIVTINKPVTSGHAVQWRAAECKRGDVLLRPGTVLTPIALAVCANVGMIEPIVFARPRVGVLSSGDEIVPADQTPTGSQIRNSNTPMLLSLLKRYGCDAVDLGHVKDDPKALSEKLSATGFDAVFVTGGMSMGAFDYTPRVLRDLGYDLAITKVKMKPGKPFVFAIGGRGAPFVFGLPGNPVSAFVCTVRLASRLLLRLAGRPPEPEWTLARLAEDLPPNGPREFYQPAFADNDKAKILAWRGSADVFTLARANALLVRAADEAKVPVHTVVSLLRLP